MVKLLHLSCSNAEEFVGSLEAYAEARGRRSLILIDALNEKGNRAYWQNHLPKMIQFLKKYPGVALAISCRSSYEPIVIPEHIVPDRLVAVIHHGFSGHEAEATTIYFRRYGIEDPTVPLLRPEFSNPLFLKLFCQSMQNEGMTRVPRGLRGITATFEFFINATHKKLARLMDYDPKDNCVKRALTLVANYMGENKLQWVPFDKAKELVNSTLPDQTEYSKTLYANLLSEGLLIENVFRADGAADIGVRLGFERFTDHLVTRSLLSAHLNSSDPAASFHPGQVLGDLFPDEHRAWANRGWIEAMSVQIPEELGSELIDFLPRARDWQIMQETFLQSLVWRDPNKCSESTHDYLNVVFQCCRHEEVYSTLLMLASDPEHPYNAKSLHRHLLKLSMPDRDCLWSIFLHHHYGNDDSMDRLLEWAWHTDKSHICEESIELCGIALTWYFTTSHRFARDRATKALVSILLCRPLVMKKLIDQFSDVNDVYVSERLYAAAYGVAMVTADDSAVAELAKSAYQHVFENENPVPHILLRDYARGIVEEALHRGMLPSEIDVKRVRPPYQSQWPLDIPSEEDISHYGEWHEHADDGEIARNKIYGSVMGRIEGDFSHYVIGESPRWSSQRIDEELGPNKTTADGFFGSLTKRQQKAWETLETIKRRVPQVLALDSESRKKYLPITDEQLQRLPKAAEDAFIAVLGKKKSAIYTKHVVSFLESKSSAEFDLLMARRWILQRVFDLGWTEDRFGYFDRWFDSGFRYGRSGHKPERIGKKYQWIAFHEFFAYVADHFFLREEFGDHKTELYDNPSQVGMRDIDPSMLLDTFDGPNDTQPKTKWWLPVDYVFHEATSEEKQIWTLDIDDVPSPQEMVETVDPSNGVNWLNLFANNTWSDRDKTDSLLSRPWREMWFHIRCYLVRRVHSDSVFARLKEENYWNKHVPEPGELYKIYLGEYPWASSCEKEEVKQRWTDEIDFHSKALPHPIANSAMRYNGISEYDCSGKESSSSFLPSVALYDSMGLRWSRDGFSFKDDSDQMIVFDPSVESDSHAALLLNKDLCLSFLAKGEYDLIWTVLGAREYHKANRAAYNGVISLSGAYRFENARLVGSMSEYIRSYDRTNNTTQDWRGRTIHQF